MKILKSALVPVLSAVAGAIVATVAWGAGIQYSAIVEAKNMAFDDRLKAINALYPASGGGIDTVSPNYQATVRGIDNHFYRQYDDIKTCYSDRSFSCAVNSFRIYSDIRGWCSVDGNLRDDAPEDQKQNAEWITLKFGNREASTPVNCGQIESGMSNLRSHMEFALQRVNQASIWDVFQCTFDPSAEDCRIATPR